MIVTKDMKDKYLGTIFGLAIGDAVGFPNEFKDPSRVRKLTDMVARPGYRLGDVTDDTQMSIALAQGILDAGPEASVNDTFLYGHIADRFRLWAQSDDNCRAPGTTCLGSIASLSQQINALMHRDKDVRWWDVIDPRKGMPTRNGCGAVMRAAPAALAYFGDDRAVWTVAEGQGIITHRCPESYAVTPMFAAAISRILEGNRISSAVIVAAKAAQKKSYDTEAIDSILRAVELGKSDVVERTAFDELGQGFYSHEALAGAVFAAVRHEGSYEATVLCAANAGGDADSLACIAGALSGAQLGLGALRYDWVSQIENSGLMVDLAEDLYAFNQERASASVVG